MKRVRFTACLLLLLGLLCGCAKENVTPNWAEQEKPTAEKPDSSGWQAQYDLGVRYLNDGNYEEAVIAFTAAIKIDPKRPEGYAARGSAYLSMAQASGDAAQYAQAADDLEQAGRLGDGSAGRREELAAAYIKQLLKKTGLEPSTVKVFAEYVPFLSRVEGLNSMMEISQSADSQLERRIRRKILNVSM